MLIYAILLVDPYKSIDEFYLNLTADRHRKKQRKYRKVRDTGSEWLWPKVAKGGQMMTQLCYSFVFCVIYLF